MMNINEKQLILGNNMTNYAKYCGKIEVNEYGKPKPN